MSKTFAIIKPDVVKQRRQAEVLMDILNVFNVDEMRQVNLTRELAESFYKEHKGRPFFGDLCDFMTSGPCIVLALSLEGDNAVSKWRNMIGETNPLTAEEGTLRNIYGTSIDNNAVHGSDSYESAEREINFFFGEIVVDTAAPE